MPRGAGWRHTPRARRCASLSSNHEGTAAARRARFPQRGVICRELRIGGRDKSQLLDDLARHAVQLNDAARQLFACDRFTTAASVASLATVELGVRDLGFPNGAAMPDLLARAASLGLRPCPLETAPHFRLQYLDQPEEVSRGTPALPHRAPPGSVTVVSEPLTDDDALPKGFYLRRLDGVSWLRGYWSGCDHLWDPGDRLLFAE